MHCYHPHILKHEDIVLLVHHKKKVTWIFIWNKCCCQCLQHDWPAFIPRMWYVRFTSKSTPLVLIITVILRQRDTQLDHWTQIYVGVIESKPVVGIEYRREFEVGPCIPVDVTYFSSSSTVRFCTLLSE